MMVYAAAAAKSLQLCPILCDPMDGSPPDSSVPGILQARTLEWVAISFSKAWKRKVKVKSLSRVWVFATPWAAAYQAPPSMGFSRQEYWSGVPSPSPDGTWRSAELNSFQDGIQGHTQLQDFLNQSCPSLDTEENLWLWSWQRGTSLVKQLLRVLFLKPNRLLAFLPTTLSATPKHRSPVTAGIQGQCMAANTDVQPWFPVTTTHKDQHRSPSSRHSLVLGGELCTPHPHSTLPNERYSFTPHFYVIHAKRKFL